MQTVAELKQAERDAKQPFTGVFLLRRVSTKRARNNSEFLAVELGDKTGLFHVVCFENSANFAFFRDLAEGTPLRVEGFTAHYQGRFSPQLTDVAALSEEEVAPYLENLQETAPEPLDALWADFQRHVALIEEPALRQTVEGVLEEIGEDFRRTPAAVSVHHAYRGGLLEHTTRMLRAAEVLLPLYPEVEADLVRAGIALHDMGKCLEYTGTMATTRSRTGILNGHVVLGYRLARRAAMVAKVDEDRLERLEHIILSHQGEPEWGAAVRAATPEAVFVSMVDNLDAKMGVVQYQLRTTPAANVFTEHLQGLMSPLLVTPVGGVPAEGQAEEQKSSDSPMAEEIRAELGLS